jgi:iron(III) transport system ATP-binding protein
MKPLKLENISVKFDQKRVINDVSLSLQSGKIGCFLGPSGCGKTTLLRVVAGFQRPDAGIVMLGGEVLSSSTRVVQPEHRNIGMVFQDFALFPHLTVAENIKFGLRGWSKRDAQRRVDDLLDLVGLSSLARSYSHQLSGGQQQRIALARALAPKPDLLLMDEPFSSMDTELREQLAREVRSILIEESMSAIIVTHDQFEAFAMADDICVLHEGRVQQQANGYSLYHEPANPFVANFIGDGVILDGQVLSHNEVKTELGFIYGEIAPNLPVGCPVQVLVRPDDVVHDDDAPDHALVVNKAFRGSEFLYTLQMPSGVRVLCLAPSHHNHAVGSKIGVRLEVDHLVVFPQH